MFSFFSKRASISEPKLAAAPPEAKSQVAVVDNELAARQLRTPSPSVSLSNDANFDAAQSPLPATVLDEVAPPSGPEPTVASLNALITSVPPKSLHSYVLAQLPDAEPPTLESLATFFATLTPPPRLHCVRCHSDYVDVENTDRSCHIPHDDESAEVDRVGRGAGGAEYETLWGCCGQTVEGDGSEGPPNGWCYEGRHTTDIKRARFRADSNPADDKLVSCLRLNCHGIRDTLPRRSNKRRRVVEHDPAEVADDAMSSGTEDSGIAEIAHGVGALGKKTPRKPKNKRVGDDASSPGASSSAKKARARPRKQPTAEKAKAKATDDGAEKPAGDAMDVDDSAPASTPVKKPRGQPRKQSAKEKRNDKEGGETAAESDAPTPARGRKVRAKTPQVEVVLRSRSQSRVSRVRAGVSAETDGEGAKADSEERKRKKRKVAAAVAT